MGDIAVETGLPEKLVQQIIKTLRDYGCKKAVIYGSRALGNYSTTSDIDLAVDCEGEIGPLEVYLSELDTLLKFDICQLNRVKEPLLSEILKNGKVIYEKI